MQSESELAAAAEKAAIEKDLENWKAIEKELSEKFEQEKRQERERQYKDREIRNRTSPQLTPEGQSMFKPLTPKDYEDIQIRATHNTNLDKQRMIEAAKDEYLKTQEKERKVEREQAENDKVKAAEQAQQKQSERTLRRGRVNELKMELAQQTTSSQKAEQTRTGTGTAAMHNDRGSAEQGLRELQQYYKDQEAGLQQERGRDRGLER
jgi:hypothetical protein